MTQPPLIACLLLFFSFSWRSCQAIKWPEFLPWGKNFELTGRMLHLSHIASELSALSYDDLDIHLVANSTKDLLDFNSTNGTASADDGSSYFEHPDYDEIRFYNSEPDQAVLAKVDGRCFAAFRGSVPTLADWRQNINLGSEDIYRKNDESTGDFCTVREGFADFTRSFISSTAQDDLIECIESCEHEEDCLIITGHSQGGASALVLAIMLVERSPLVITFGAPTAAFADCDLIDSSRYYRYVNTFERDGGSLGVDGIALLSRENQNSVHYGRFLLLGPRSANILYIDDDTYEEIPRFGISTLSRRAHHMTTIDVYDEDDVRPHSYQSRMASLAQGTLFQVDGFPPGTPCQEDHESYMCQSGECLSSVCTNCTKGDCDNTAVWLEETLPTAAPTTAPTVSPTFIGASSAFARSPGHRLSLGWLAMLFAGLPLMCIL